HHITGPDNSNIVDQETFAQIRLQLIRGLQPHFRVRQDVLDQTLDGVVLHKGGNKLRGGSNKYHHDDNRDHPASDRHTLYGTNRGNVFHYSCSTLSMAPLREKPGSEVRPSQCIQITDARPTMFADGT